MQSVQRVVSDGTLQIVDLSISYFDRSEIAVYINSELYTAWHWASDVEDRIIFNSPIPAGVEVLIKRTTDISKLRHYFSKGSAFTAEALDEDLQQVLHIAQEATEASLSGDFFTDIDMHGYRVRNIGPAVDDSDALTLRQYKQDAQGAWVARNQAEQFKNEAASYASSAQTSANNSAASAQDSLAAVGSAQAYATSAAASASAAAQSATNAAASATAAAQSATNAAASFDEFDDRYLGAKPSDPVTDNDDNALQVGALYWNTTINEMRVWTGSSWRAAAGSLVGNADTATKLQTARLINGTAFDGTADITTAKWGTARTITIGNTSKSVDGYADVSWSLAEIGVTNADGNYIVNDTRYVDTPTDLGERGVKFEFKENATDGLNDGGAFHAVMTFQQWRDSTGGNTHQLGFTDNGNLWLRTAPIGGTWGQWREVYHSGNLGAATESSAGIVKLATTAEAQALASAVVALTPARLADAFKGANQSLSANGYQRLPGGLIIQWGSGTATLTQNLPVAFPNAPLVAQATIRGAVAFFVAVESLTTTQIIVRAYNRDGSGASPAVSWIAIGY